MITQKQDIKKTDLEIEQEIEQAKKKVKVGGIYSHYKNPENKYEVLGFATQEANAKLCVIYRTLYGKKLTFIRDLDVWLEKPLWKGKKVTRFTLIS